MISSPSGAKDLALAEGGDGTGPRVEAIGVVDEPHLRAKLGRQCSEGRVRRVSRAGLFALLGAAA